MILLLAIPVTIIAGISLSVYFLLLWLYNLFSRGTSISPQQDLYHLELNLVDNEWLRIILIEDELDTELSQLNETWQEKVYNEETCLYRVKTIPFIPALEGGICCFYCKEQEGGILLQVLPAGNINQRLMLSSQLIFLNYTSLQISLVDETGAFYLYNDDQIPQVISGFNKTEKISIELIPAGSGS